MRGDATRAIARETYWATAPREELAAELQDRIDEFYDACEESGRLDLWRRSTRLYYGLDADGGWKRSTAVTFGGKAGELSLVRVNHYRSLVHHIHTLVTGNRPALQARASNNDHASGEQTMTASMVLEWYFKRKRIEDALRRAGLWALYLAEGWIYQTWDPNAGNAYGADPETGSIVYEGDIVTVPKRPIDVIRDPDAVFEGDDEPPWVIVRSPVSRWELAATYPEHYDTIRGLTACAADERQALWTRSSRKSGGDFVYQFEFYHERTRAVADGRYSLMFGDKIVEDGPLPYQTLPVHPMFPDNEDEGAFGYSPAYDLMAPQQCLDAAVSTIQTNHDAHGVQTVLIPSGSNLDVRALTQGLRGMTYNAATGAKPEVLDLMRLHGEQFKLIDYWERTMETISAVNSVARGNPDDNLKSGSALALVQSMAVQYHSGMHGAYARLCERVGNSTLQLAKTFVKNERTAEIVGQDEHHSIKYWSGESFRDVEGVVVELANPLTQTSAGRQDLADKLLQNKLIKTAEQYSMVLATGRSEPLYKHDRDELRFINDENLKLRRGEEVSVLVSDRHDLHLREHAPVLFDPDLRLDNKIAGAALAHLMEHMTALKSTDPVMLIAMGVDSALVQLIQQMAAAPPPGAPTPVDGSPPSAPGGAPPPVDPNVPPMAVDPVAEGMVQSMGDMPRMPSMPVSPIGPTEAFTGGQ